MSEDDSSGADRQAALSSFGSGAVGVTQANRGTQQRSPRELCPFQSFIKISKARDIFVIGVKEALYTGTNISN